MKIKDIIAQKIVYGMCLVAAMFGGGCTEEFKAQMAKERQAMEEREAEQKRLAAERAAAKKRLDATSMKLIGKYYAGSVAVHYNKGMCGFMGGSVFEYAPQTVLFFDTDGNTNTVEWVAVKSAPCDQAANRVVATRAGNTQTKAQWERHLSHAWEEQCGVKYADDAFRKKMHQMTWDPVEPTLAPTISKGSAEQGKTAAPNEIPFRLVGKYEGKERVYRVNWGDRSPCVVVKNCTLQFDTDGDINTVEWVATKEFPCAHVAALIELAKDGDARTKAGWEAYLQHANEGRCCHPLKEKVSRDTHCIKWDRIRE